MITLKAIRTLTVVLSLIGQAMVAYPALAVDSDAPTGTADLTSVRAKIDAENYPAAIEELRGLAEDYHEVDVYNLLGFSLRKTGDYETSLTYYNKALALQPDYKPAREYLGELFLDTGDIPKAKEQLAELVRLCPDGCEERADLEEALKAKTGG